MISRAAYRDAQERAAAMMIRAGLHLAPDEWSSISVADFGLSRLEEEGAQILTFVNTERISAKIIALFPNQTLPEHWHPPMGDDPGKEETLRAISGPLRLYTPGEDTLREGSIPGGRADCYTCRNERIMQPGDTLTVPPGVPHWLQAGRDGAVVYSFSTCARDVLDGFTDGAVVRETIVTATP